MTNNIFISYNGTQLYPTPLINYQQEPVTFGYVYGYNTAITLDGYYSGISTGVSSGYPNTTGLTISGITSIFANQFGNLKVTDDIGNTLYDWSGITIDSIDLEPNLYFQGSFIKYAIRLMSFSVPNGVMEPSNEYSFTQNEDGTVSVNHKISARGVRNINGAFQNTVNFVQQFTGKDPFANCAPYFVPGGSGVLLSLTENIDRAAASYGVTEVYKYNTGVSQPYVTTSTLDTSEDLGSEFKTINFNVKYWASPIYKDLDAIINSNINTDNILADITSEYGFNTSNWVKTSYAANVDSGSAIVDVKIGYVSGANPSGFFDYVVTNDQDLINFIENWKIEGQFRCFGPLDYKIQQFNLFKQQEDGSNWRSYLTGIIVNTPLFSNLHDSNKKFTQNTSVQVIEDTLLGDIKLSLTLDMGYEPFGVADLKYTLNASPAQKIYQLLPSANIEGNFIIQDLQVCSQPNQEFTLSCNTYNKLSGLSILNGYMTGLVNVYVNSGTNNNITAFLREYSVSTGTYSVSIKQKWLGSDIGISSVLTGLQSVGADTVTVPIRVTGYNFGY